MNKCCNLILFLLIGCFGYSQQPISSLQRYEIFGKAQGTTYTISYYYPSEVIQKTSVDSIFNVIDKSMSLYIPESKISEFNSLSSKQIKLDPHIYKVLKSAFYVNKDSKGLFDITVKPLVELWGFGPQKLRDLPDSNQVKATLKTVGMDKLKFSGKTLKKMVRGVQIDLNGIAQGYTVDVLHDFLLKKKIKNFIVEVGGEIRTHGQKPNNESFKVLIQRPESTSTNSTFVVELTNKSITTSGSYENYRQVENYNFSHHMDPRTGYPLRSKIISVTVIANKAIEADAYDNVFMAMSPKEAVSFANSKNIMDIYLLYLEEGVVKEAFSSGFKNYLLTD